MNLLKELSQLREGAVKDAVMDLIDRAVKQADTDGHTYPEAVDAIVKQLKKIDHKEFTGGMTTTELRGLVRQQFEPSDLKESGIKGLKVVPTNDNGLGSATNFHDVALFGKVIGMVWEDAGGTWSAKLSNGTSWDGFPNKDEAVEQITDDMNLNEDDAAYASSPEGADGEKKPEEEEEKPKTKVIAKADEYTVEQDEDEQIHIIDGEGIIRLSMPLIIWNQLKRS
jgi:hypothetical protein